MRKLILSAQVSLDGYVAGPNGDSSWMPPDNDEGWDGLFREMRDVDLFVLGAGMWPEYRDHWKQALGNPEAPPKEQEYARLAAKTRHLVFSGTLREAGWENASIESGDLAAAIRRLKALPGKDIMTFGGARFAASLVDGGLVDEYRITVCPAIVGGGKSTFHLLKNARKLELVEVIPNAGMQVATLRYRAA
jgi:dihydrofolate reductase